MSLSLFTSLGLSRGGFSPADIAGLQLWLDAADESTITESGGAVSQWDDKSGNGNHVVQATAASQPTTGTHTLNGLNTLYNDGGDFMLTGSALSLSGFTTFAVFEHIAENGMFFGTDLNTAYGPVYELGNNGSGAGSNIGSTSIYVNGTLLTSTTRNDIYSAVNAQSNVTSTIADGTITRKISPFAWPNSATVTAEQKMAEFLVYDSALSTVDRESVEAHLAAKWGITLA